MGLWREMEGDRKDTGGGVALEKAHFTDEETKAQIGNTDLALPFCKTCPFPSETLSASKQFSCRMKVQNHGVGLGVREGKSVSSLPKKVRASARSEGKDCSKHT